MIPSARLKWSTFAAVTCAALALCVVAPATAQEFKGFVPSGEFTVKFNGEDLADSTLYHSEQSGAFLIMSPNLKAPVLMNTRGRVAQGVSFMKVTKHEDGSIDLLPDAVYKTFGPLKPSGKTVSFDVDGAKMVLTTKPALLGTQNEDSLAEYNPSYAYKAAKYKADAKQITELKGEARDVTVKIFFGTWCPVCSRLVPKVMNVSETLEGSKIKFEYYGLPRMMSDDPVTDELKLRGVPTGVVYVNGKEIGRLSGQELYKPESGLQKVLSGA